jgi:xanthine dehydrogenase small subunit
MRDFVLFYVNGRREEVRGERLFQSLSDFLRYDRQLVGTKVVCAEGDCGSCSVLIGRPTGDTIAYRNVTACIQYVYQLDGVHIITVEGLKHDGQLSCVQEAMVTCQGSQCGYCTPGFVISMHALLESRPKLTDADLRLGLSGNLCRCTGYESIIKAGT